MKNYPGQRRSPARTPLPAAAARASVPRPARGLCAHALRARSLASGLPRSSRARCSALPRSLHPSVHPAQPVCRVPTLPSVYLGPFLLSLFSRCSQSPSRFPSVFHLSLFYLFCSLSPLCISPLSLCPCLSLVNTFAAFVPFSLTLLPLSGCLFLSVPACPQTTPPSPTGVSVPLWQLLFKICSWVSLFHPCSLSLWVLPSLGFHVSQSTPTQGSPPPCINGPHTPYPLKAVFLTADQRLGGSSRLWPAQPSPAERWQVGWGCKTSNPPLKKQDRTRKGPVDIQALLGSWGFALVPQHWLPHAPPQ